MGQLLAQNGQILLLLLLLKIETENRDKSHKRRISRLTVEWSGKTEHRQVEHMGMHHPHCRRHLEMKRIKLLRIKFPSKNSVGTHVYLPQEWSSGFQRLPPIKYYILIK